MKLYLVWQPDVEFFEFVTAGDIDWRRTTKKKWAFLKITNNYSWQRFSLFDSTELDEDLCRCLFGKWTPKKGECWEIKGERL